MDLKFEIWREEREMFDELRRERERDDDDVRNRELRKRQSRLDIKGGREEGVCVLRVWRAEI